MGNDHDMYLEVRELGHVQQALCSVHAALSTSAREHSYKGWNTPRATDGLLSASANIHTFHGDAVLALY